MSQLTSVLKANQAIFRLSLNPFKHKLNKRKLNSPPRRSLDTMSIYSSQETPWNCRDAIVLISDSLRTH